MTGQVLLGLNNRIGAATLTATNAWEAAMPLTNVKTPFLAEVARSTTADDFTLTVSFAGLTARAIGVVAIAGHNLSRDATMQVKTYQGATLLDDSGVLAVWPYLHADDPFYTAHTFSAAIVDADRVADLVTSCGYYLPGNAAGNKVTITVSDSGNSTGYLEIGRVFVGELLSPDFNVEYGDVSYSRTDLSEINKSKRGVKFARQYRSMRVATTTFKNLAEGEAVGGVVAAQRVAGLVGEVLWSPGWPEYVVIDGAKAVSSFWFERFFLGNFTALDALTNPYLDAFSMALAVEEVML
ncbi:hypothetical protein [Methylovulum psychrotolerans]|uniref:Uncharacterized protein n=1 Tax=Methylovulum psychrotolerans TaxID=1704499 RepID=A0A2S5CGH4_9GAMM|nr:hypothetical protein [Methylovulum psychrotolerans]POZ49908.1 hypothetical protein AADEFJLK_04354 [Methylovulum psychrotolerans]